jgi:2'-5' RNA ligase
MAAEPRARRVFFAIWPDAATRERLAALSEAAHAAFGGRRMRADTLHMTLAFIGDVASARVDSVLRAGDELHRLPALSMSIDQLRCWRDNRIVWCGPTAFPDALGAVAEQLGQRLSAEGFRLDARPFAAHATLLRNADCTRAAAGFEAFEWKVSQIVLVESSLAAAGARYAIVGRWPLAQ